MSNVFAIIVVYFPDVKQLDELINILSGQTQKIVIVDNSDNQYYLSFSDVESDIHYIKLGVNKGIAKAQNVGIEKALELDAADIIFFDQDSKPSSSLIEDLLVARNTAKNDGLNVAAIGPSHIDSDSNEPARFISIDNNNITLFKPRPAVPYMECGFIIASGGLIEVKILEEVGVMEEGLFIDCVDIEWGFRAKSLGLVSLCAPNAHMHHKIGDSPLILFGRQLTTHSPIRHYYFYRNFYLLLKRDYVPFAWKKSVLFKSMIQACVFCLLLKPRFQHFKAIAKGIHHGLAGKYGKYEE
tara:strand:+ start:21245 stop:22138 length:894 start_codon:yes stop_codon:yes gene_type:complete